MRTIFRFLTISACLALTGLTAAEIVCSPGTADAAECAREGQIDQLSTPECQKGESPSDSALKRREVLDNSDITIQYEGGIDRNRAPGFIQAIIDLFDFICFWK